MNTAAEEFFSKGLGGASKSGKSSGGALDMKKIETIFNQFKDTSTGNMESEGIEVFYS
jgi:hypothetical protein